MLPARSDGPVRRARASGLAGSADPAGGLRGGQG